MRLLMLLLFSVLTALPAAAAEFTKPKQPVVLHEDAQLPAIPEGWVSVRGPFTTVHGPEDDYARLIELSRHAEARLPELSSGLRVGLGGDIEIYVADSMQRFRELQPGRAPMWADGVAYPSLGLILLRSPRIRGGTAEPLETVLDHELVHVLLGRAFAPNTPPSWLQEGLAQVWAGEVGPETTATLAQGVAAGSLLSLQGLSRGFPTDPVRARVAYAQSADFIGWLRDVYGEEALGRLIREMANGKPIEGALHAATGDFIEPIERRWRSRLETSGLSLGIFANMDLLLGLGGIVLVIGGIARRRRFHRRVAEMEAEEDALDALIGSYVADRDPPYGRGMSAFPPHHVH